MSKYEDLVTAAADLAKSAEWKDADELVKKMRDVGSAAHLAKGVKGDAAAIDTAADELIKKMQALGNAVDDLANGAKGEALAAEAARDDAQKAASKGMANKAAEEAEKHQGKAMELAQLSSTVMDTLALTLQVIGNATKKQNAGIVATRAAVGAATVHRYADRAERAASGARSIASTA